MSAIRTPRFTARPEIAIPDISLVDQHGARISLRALLDREHPILVDFVFTSCSAICPVISTSLRGTAEDFASRSESLTLVSISIDPENDTASELSHFAARHHAGTNWHFLTGKLADVVAVQRAFGIYRGNKMSHVPAIFARVPRSATWRRLDGLVTTGQLIGALRELTAQ